MSDEFPLNRMPGVILAIAGAMLLAEAVFSLASAGILGGRTGIGWRSWAVQDYAFAPRVLELLGAPGGAWSPDLLKRFVTYAFVHGSVTNTAFAVVITLALGKFCGEVLGEVQLAALWLACTVGGALVFGLAVQENAALIGGFPGAYGLIGAYTYLLWVHLGRQGARQLAAFRLIGVLVALQLIFSVFFGPSPIWVAEIAGFVLGFAITPVLVPGGWTALLAKLRER
ncbi:rhomboid family intramembrane serine protease [Histidinibacterium aquaticum]|uniref:Rhomboid family intramembrane serine protease n=1 Tax=Histidinibacterium aquaticum TaxID=2613962 RepID=A0A5J5GAR0_9RHOB|nr:rhomboid family intramembrane serine protease [Histidinibacterium aquaticum]KAA9005195.1 rhomboid family intramembrane serine protease [Histidinibacterium aquaticum]